MPSDAQVPARIDPGLPGRLQPGASGRGRPLPAHCPPCCIEPVKRPEQVEKFEPMCMMAYDYFNHLKVENPSVALVG